MWSPRFPAALALGAALCTAPRAARADDAVTVNEIDPRTGEVLRPPSTSITYFNPGFLVSVIGGPEPATALGVEGSLMTYPAGRIPSFGYGALAQLQLYDGKTLRGALGVQGALGPVGVELGLGLRQGESDIATTFSTHTGQFISLGWLSIGLRESIPLLGLPSHEPAFGFETAVVIGLKVPIIVQGNDPTGMVVRASGHPW